MTRDARDLHDDALDHAVETQFAPRDLESRPNFAQRVDDIVRDHCGGYLHREIAAALRELAADMREAEAR